ncbi:hypothetical protein [Ileibacterium valens]|uniref:hypothetical protein n=1 Tax=Ileibacterium valens TaxID=1862668 RepID=UPI00272D1FA2|nr:hypothetical protein [Ileibacterium valens]
MEEKVRLYVSRKFNLAEEEFSIHEINRLKESCYQLTWFSTADEYLKMFIWNGKAIIEYLDSCKDGVEKLDFVRLNLLSHNFLSTFYSWKEFWLSGYRKQLANHFFVEKSENFYLRLGHYLRNYSIHQMLPVTSISRHLTNNNIEVWIDPALLLMNKRPKDSDIEMYLNELVSSKKMIDLRQFEKSLFESVIKLLNDVILPMVISLSEEPIKIIEKVSRDHQVGDIKYFDERIASKECSAVYILKSFVDKYYPSEHPIHKSFIDPWNQTGL